MKSVFKKRGLKYYIWLDFILFLLVDFALFWIFQVIFMEPYYQKRMTAKVDDIVLKISEVYSSPNAAIELRLLALENNICMSIVDITGRLSVDIDTQDQLCILHSDDNFRDVCIQKVLDSDTGIYSDVMTVPKVDREVMIYATTFPAMQSDAAYIIISMPIKPIAATASIIKQQMLYIILILFVFSIAIAYFTANSIAQPIEAITITAEHLAAGNYRTKFDGGDYLEVQRLADSLNYAANEISKTDSLQRDLIANVSHDLRTPLTMIKAYAEMVRDLSGGNPEKREEHLNIIIEETDRLALLVSDMLDLSKLESGGLVMNYSQFGITRLLYEIAERYEELCRRNGFDFEFIPDEEVMVRCDEGKIQQVIYNLLNNAINYTRGEKKVRIRQINSFNFVKIEVTDSGPGIEPENLHLVFDKYYRTEKSKREVVGTGLGLSIVQGILKKHNFPYGVQSEVGKGSTFWFKITQL